MTQGGFADELVFRFLAKLGQRHERDTQAVKAQRCQGRHNQGRIFSIQAQDAP